jgi:LemA protein
MSTGLALIGVVVLIALYVVGTYNKFQTLKTRITASIQEIGNQLKRQSNLIPNLESSAKGYLKHEKDIFKKLTDARKQIDSATKSKSPQKMVDASSALSQLMPALKIAVEDNPELKGEKTVSKLMDELRDTADKVMYARRTLIDLSADYNRLVITVPSNVVASMFKFKTQPGLTTPDSGEHIEVSTADAKSPKVSF